MVRSGVNNVRTVYSELLLRRRASCARHPGESGSVAPPGEPQRRRGGVATGGGSCGVRGGSAGGCDDGAVSARGTLMEGGGRVRVVAWC